MCANHHKSVITYLNKLKADRSENSAHRRLQIERARRQNVALGRVNATFVIEADDSGSSEC